MVEDGKKTGLHAAVEATVDTSKPPVEEPEQLALLPLDRPEVATAAAEVAVPRRGRPPGATNKSTAEWRDYLLGQYSSPLVALAETYSMPLEDLAKRLGCDKVEAFKVQVAAAKELAPYLHQKQPIAIQGDGTGLVSLILAMPGGSGAPEDLTPTGVVLDAEIIDQDGNQGKSEG